MPRRNQPTKHIRYEKPVGCATKRRFSSELAANNALAEQKIVRPEVSLRIYQCPYCSGWHFTSSNNG